MVIGKNKNRLNFYFYQILSCSLLMTIINLIWKRQLRKRYGTVITIIVGTTVLISLSKLTTVNIIKILKNNILVTATIGTATVLGFLNARACIDYLESQIPSRLSILQKSY